MSYYSQRRLRADFEDVVEQTETALQEEGFGLLADIDVQSKFAEKLDVEDSPQYRILGACNPPLAKQGIDADPDLGTLLPCNVIVREAESGEIVVSAVDAEELLSVVDNTDLDSIAADVATRFERVLDTVEEAAEP